MNEERITEVVTEETEYLIDKAIAVLLDSDLSVEEIVTAAELIGIEGPPRIREYKDERNNGETIKAGESNTTEKIPF